VAPVPVTGRRRPEWSGRMETWWNGWSSSGVPRLQEEGARGKRPGASPRWSPGPENSAPGSIRSGSGSAPCPRAGRPASSAVRRWLCPPGRGRGGGGHHRRGRRALRRHAGRPLTADRPGRGDGGVPGPLVGGHAGPARPGRHLAAAGGHHAWAVRRPARGDVSDRFGADAAACHAVARAESGELAGLRDRASSAGCGWPGARTPTWGPSRRPTSPGFFGGASAADTRAARSFARVQERLGVEAVLIGRLQGGRDPAEQSVLVPWGSPRRRRPGGRRVPWPGRLPPPAPTEVLRVPQRAEVVDAAPAGLSR
jgi:hypothetical protein